ncbi:hypothetical protein [Microcoleus sp. Pol12B5]
MGKVPDDKVKIGSTIELRSPPAEIRTPQKSQTEAGKCEVAGMEEF